MSLINQAQERVIPSNSQAAQNIVRWGPTPISSQVLQNFPSSVVLPLRSRAPSTHGKYLLILSSQGLSRPENGHARSKEARCRNFCETRRMSTALWTKGGALSWLSTNPLSLIN
jgi:hypothetical protein